jgi:predicted HTH transcriptional regulator
LFFNTENCKPLIFLLNRVQSGIFGYEIEESSGDADLPQRSLEVLQLLSRHERMTIAEMVKATGGNQNTLKVRLRELVASGRINRHGKGRATWYTGKA